METDVSSLRRTREERDKKMGCTQCRVVLGYIKWTQKEVVMLPIASCYNHHQTVFQAI